jgi:hypothetical protein
LSRRPVSFFSALLSNSSLSVLVRLFLIVFSSRKRRTGRRGNQPARRHRNSRHAFNRG